MATYRLKSGAQWCEPIPVIVRKIGVAYGALGDAMKFTVTLDRDEDGVWVAECPAIPGCVSQGGTKQDALEAIQEAIQLCLEVRSEYGMPLRTCVKIS